MTTTKKATGREKLSSDAVVTSAMELADAEGLEAVTIRRLAQDHGVTPMALYWHFKDKEALLDGIAERLFAPVVVPALDDRPWVEQLSELITQFLDAIRPHPTMADIAKHRILRSPSGLALSERCLALLLQGGFTPDEAAELGMYIVHSVISFVTALPAAGPEAIAVQAEELEAKRATLALLKADEYPALVACAEALMQCNDEERYFELGVRALIDGIEAVSPA